jgi:hypothetical protein
MTALIETSSDRWMRMIRSTGVVGLVTFVVLFAALIASLPGEPPFLASPQDALAFYLNTTAGWVQAAMAVVGLAAIGWIWFVVGLCLLLGRAEGSPPWRSAVALVCGVILGAFLLLSTSGNAASFGAADLNLAVASYAFDVTSLGFANIWLALGSFAACCGWVVLSTPRRRSLAWLVGDRQRVGARARPVLLDIVDLASAVRRLLDLDAHHVHPACPEARCAAEGERQAKPALAVTDRDCCRRQLHTLINRRCPSAVVVTSI